MAEFFESIQATALLMAISCVAFGWCTVKLVTGLKRDGKLGWPLGLILIIAVALRWAWSAFSQPEPMSDFHVYWDYAAAFHQGDMTYDTIIRHPGPSVLFYFSTLLFGNTLWAAWILNIALSVVLMLLLFDLARRMAGDRAGYLAAGIGAIFPQFVTYSALTASEIMAVAFSLLFLWGFMDAWQAGNRKPLTWIALGFLLYGTLLIRISNILYLGLIPLMWLLFDRQQIKSWVLPFVTLTATTGLLLFSWAYHQYLVTDGAGFKLFYGSELGFACAVENRDGAYMYPRDWSFYPKLKPFYESNHIADRIKGYELTGVEARRIIMEDPGAYLLNGFTRMRRVLNTAQTGLRWSEKGSPQVRALPGKTVKRAATVSNIFWQVVLYASPLALLLYRRRLSDEARRILTFLILYFSSWYAFHLVMALSNERYGFQVMPYMLILFAGGVISLLDWLFSRKTAISQEALPSGTQTTDSVA